MGRMHAGKLAYTPLDRASPKMWVGVGISFLGGLELDIFLGGGKVSPPFATHVCKKGYATGGLIFLVCL